MARRLLIAASLSVAALVWSGCGSQGVEVSKSAPLRKGAVLFAERCGACHTLTPAGTQGSATNVGDRENVDGPNFDTRVEKVAIAQFLAKYAGTKVARAPSAGGVKPTGAGGTPSK